MDNDLAGDGAEAEANRRDGGTARARDEVTESAAAVDGPAGSARV